MPNFKEILFIIVIFSIMLFSVYLITGVTL